MAEQNEQTKQWAKIVAKAWADEDYKKRLMDDPASVLAEEGMELREGVKINVVEATDKQTWMVLPPKPADSKIQEGESRIAAATCAGACCSPGFCCTGG